MEYGAAVRAAQEVYARSSTERQQSVGSQVTNVRREPTGLR